MKISADFYTPDEAAYAAGVIKNQLPEIKNVSISGKADFNYGRKAVSTSMSEDYRGFSVQGYGNTYGLTGGTPVGYVGTKYRSSYDPEKRGRYTVNVVCPNDKTRTVSGILVNRGGHNITSE